MSQFRHSVIRNMAAVQVCYEGDGCLDDGPNPIKRGIPPRGNFEASGGWHHRLVDLICWILIFIF